MASKQSGESSMQTQHSRTLAGAKGVKSRVAEDARKDAQRRDMRHSLSVKRALESAASSQGGSTQSSVLQPMDNVLAGGLVAQGSSAAPGAMDEGQPGELGQSAHPLAPLPSSAAGGAQGPGRH
jgi:hypothetical protein